MKRFLLIGFLVIGLFGCAWIKDQKANVTTCYNDPQCYQDAMDKAREAGIKAGDLASLSGFPWAEKVAKPLAGYSVLLFSLAVLGASRRKFEASK